jgi:light-regulated signal transduction histidine kinase (bacteriophytochrome)
MMPLNYIFDQPITLTNCDLEPIHIPNAIQSHGVLLVINEEKWEILQVSNNTESLLGYLPEELLNKSLIDIFDSESQDAIARCLAEDFDAVNPLNLNLLNPQNETILFYGIVHRSPDRLIILELETSTGSQPYNFFHFYQSTRYLLSKIQDISNIGKIVRYVVAL